MSNCTFKYIENQFRQTDPEKADYFNNLSLDTWAELKDSKLFKEKTKEDKKQLYVNNPNTKKRQSQDVLINGINAKLGASIVNISNENFITVNTSPLFNIPTEDKFFIEYIRQEAEKNNVDLTKDNCK